MSLLHRSAAVSACVLVVCGLLLSQQKPAPPPAQGAAKQQEIPTFSTTRTEVIVPVTVTDEKGKFVSNLVASDFRVLDEGKPQRIEFFSHAEKQPVVVGFLVDLSNQSKVHWAKYQEAIEELVLDLLPGDPRYAGYLIGYSNEAEPAV